MPTARPWLDAQVLQLPLQQIDAMPDEMQRGQLLELRRQLREMLEAGTLAQLGISLRLADLEPDPPPTGADGGAAAVKAEGA